MNFMSNNKDSLEKFMSYMKKEFSEYDDFSLNNEIS